MFVGKLSAIGAGLVAVGLAGSRGPAADPPANPDPAWEAFDRLAADGEWQRERPALDDLKKLGEKAKELLLRQAKNHPEDRVRDYCYELLTDRFPTDPRVVERAARGLSDPADHIRYRLAFWLGEQKAFAAHRQLRHLLDDKAADERTKLAAAKSLAQLGDGDVLRSLYAGLESDWYVERMMGNRGVKALAGKDLNDFGGYDWREGATVISGREAATPFDPIRRADRRGKRYAAVKAYFEWLKAGRPDLYKHLTGAD